MPSLVLKLLQLLHQRSNVLALVVLVLDDSMRPDLKQLILALLPLFLPLQLLQVLVLLVLPLFLKYS